MLVLFALLHWRVAGTDLVSRLLAAGSGASAMDLGVAVSYLAARLAVMVLLPAFLVYRLTRVVHLALRPEVAGEQRRPRTTRRST